MSENLREEKREGGEREESEGRDGERGEVGGEVYVLLVGHANH
ncbi:hypothetical protein [Corynebacterium sp. CNJ-954]|nr:hypothetical protein [Corynebacterium sp. CNJ-954]